MSELATGIFVGRAVKYELAIGPTSEHATYVCVLLEGKDSRPGVTICEQADLEALITDYQDLTHSVSILDRLGKMRMVFDAPSGVHPVIRSSGLVRYECMDAAQIDKFLKIWD